MKFFLDHDIPEDIALLLRHWGHEVTRLRDVLPISTPDPDAWAYAGTHGLLVITCNRAHFLALANATAVYPGLIVLNRCRTRQAERAHLLGLLRRSGEQGLLNNINFA